MRNRFALLLLPIALSSLAAKGGCEASEEPIVGPAADAGNPDAPFIGDCPIPEPTCAAGTTFSVAGCTCVPSPDADAATLDAASLDATPGIDSSLGFSDCPIPVPATSPIIVYIWGTAGSDAGAYTVTASGSAGDDLTLTNNGVANNGSLIFEGTGGAYPETYDITVDYGSTVVFQAKDVGYSVSGCGFSKNVYLGTDAQSP
jgi:hypothetical protein